MISYGAVLAQICDFDVDLQPNLKDKLGWYLVTILEYTDNHLSKIGETKLFKQEGEASKFIETIRKLNRENKPL